MSASARRVLALCGAPRASHAMLRADADPQTHEVRRRRASRCPASCLADRLRDRPRPRPPILACRSSPRRGCGDTVHRGRGGGRGGRARGRRGDREGDQPPPADAAGGVGDHQHRDHAAARCAAVDGVDRPCAQTVADGPPGSCTDAPMIGDRRASPRTPSSTAARRSRSSARGPVPPSSLASLARRHSWRREGLRAVRPSLLAGSARASSLGHVAAGLSGPATPATARRVASPARPWSPRAWPASPRAWPARSRPGPACATRG